MMFNRIGRLYRTARLLMKLDRAHTQGQDEGRRFVESKALAKSKTIWGTAIAQAALVVHQVGLYLQGESTLDDLLVKGATAVGWIVAAFGARRAVGKLMESKPDPRTS